jgi:hypothetical protein
MLILHSSDEKAIKDDILLCLWNLPNLETV